MPMLLPVAPRPFADETIRSWMGRIAARYGTDWSTFVERLLQSERTASDFPRYHEINWRPNAELERRLAQATRVEADQITDLRIIARHLVNPASWNRRFLVWCPLCIAEDIQRCGEVYERAIWQLGFTVVCPRHHITLQSICPSCHGSHCLLTENEMRQRLMCASCGRLIDKGGRIAFDTYSTPVHYSAFGWKIDSKRIASALSLQSDILGAISGRLSGRIRNFRLLPHQFAEFAMDMAAIILISTQRRGEGRLIRPVHAYRDTVFTLVDNWTILDILGAASCIVLLSRQWNSGHNYKGPMAIAAPADIVDILSTFSSEQLAWVGEASPKWGPVLGPAVRHMLGIEEERKREGQTELKPARTSRRGNPPPIKKLLALERSRTNLLLSPVKRVRRRRTAPNSTGRQQGLVERTVDHHQGRD